MQDSPSSSAHAPGCPCCGGSASSADAPPPAGPDDRSWLDSVRWDADGLVPAIAQDADTGRVLMVAWMNRESLALTVAQGVAVYWSRSRQRLWRKGEESGHTQRVIEMRVDCDQDAVWLRVEQKGPGACHTGRKSCFYRAVPLGQSGEAKLEFREADKAFDPANAYRKG